MDDYTHWNGRLETLRQQAGTLTGGTGLCRPLTADAGRDALARLREMARSLFDDVLVAYGPFCPPEFPMLEDNGIPGPGGATGVRFSRWHAFFFALEHAGKRKPPPKPPGLTGATGVPFKRMPGQPLPPPDPNVELTLVALSLRWDESRGWVEVRRRLPETWDVAVLSDHLAAYLSGLNYDLAAPGPGLRPDEA